MSNVINLNQVRKARAKAERRRTAEENSAKHGRGKAERRLDAARRNKAKADLDGHKQDEE